MSTQNCPECGLDMTLALVDEQIYIGAFCRDCRVFIPGNNITIKNNE